ncbi:hypothetical protein [Nitratireductor indicus]|uniref:hypothetical protein n=1 Tax=Nitratireductor indicus TaxID=721133 RepID=UPI0028744C8B|nr:hypothetical protein [Nitratireductor indicus]MDS1135600.1 hypothetical protein [Nitratireductor indicus]
MFIVIALAGAAQLFFGFSILQTAPAITQEIAGLILITGGIASIALSVVVFHAVSISDRLAEIAKKLDMIEDGSAERAKPVAEMAEVIGRMRRAS